jgi:hypothetical protein
MPQAGRHILVKFGANRWRIKTIENLKKGGNNSNEKKIRK